MTGSGGTDSVDVDVVIIGSGAGGGTMARALGGSGASVIVLERGDWLPQEKQNWDPTAVWREQRYRAVESWINRHGKPFRPFMHYMVGGNTKMWGAVLYRLRAEDFGVVQHRDGLSPAWPIDYEMLAPWYDRAEAMYQVRGDGTDDPTEPERKPYPLPPVPHDPAFAVVVDRLRDHGLTPSHLPLGLITPGEHGGCILCTTCNSFPCLVRGKCDADTMGMTPALAHDNVTLWTQARADRLITDSSGRRVVAVEVDHAGRRRQVRANTVVVAAGAVNSAALMLRSANDRHPDGLANRSGLVGRRYMAHLATMIEAFHPLWVNDTGFQKTVAINDFYFTGGPDQPYPLGQIQSQGRAHAPIVKEVTKVLPLAVCEAFIRRGVDWLAMSEDLPDPANRVSLAPDGRIRLDYKPNNVAAHRELVKRTVATFRELGYWAVIRYMFKNENTTHQCGTMIFGHDPATSVLDTYCRAHDLDNTYVVDASFFPSSGAVNPGLTIIAQSLRVADHLMRTEL